MRVEKHLILTKRQISCEFTEESTWIRSMWNSLDFEGIKGGLSSSISLTKSHGLPN